MTLLMDTAMVAPQDRPEFWGQVLVVLSDTAERLLADQSVLQASYLGGQAA